MNKSLKYKIVVTALLIMVSIINTQAQSTFSGERLRDACLKYIYAEVGNNAVVTLSQDIPDQAFDESNITAKIVAARESLKGNCFVAIEFLNDNKLVRRIQVPARIKLYRLVPVAVNTITRSSVIMPGDVTMQKMDITYYRNDDIPNEGMVEGSKTRRNIAKGSVITFSALEQASLIKRGDKVQVIVEAGAVKIRTIGTALQDAACGGEVKVKRENSQVILQGRVAKDGTVVISSL